MQDLITWATAVVESLGYLGVAVLVALENLFPPLPSEIFLPLAGFVAASGEAPLAGMILAATIGSLAGALILYSVAAAIGPTRLRALVTRHGRWFGLTEEDLDRSEQWFDGRATRAVLVCRCIPLLRSLISIPAGFRRMPLLPFTVYTLLGSLVWNLLLIGAGYLLGDEWQQAGEPVDLLQNAVLIVLGVALVWFVWRRLIQTRLRRAR